MKDEWIKPEQMMPTTNRRVLVERKTLYWDNYYVDIAHWDGKMWMSNTDGCTISVKGWMELPEVE